MAFFNENKTLDNIEEYDVGSNEAERVHVSALGGTAHDAQEMHRMGKKQELRVSMQDPIDLVLRRVDFLTEELPIDLDYWIRRCAAVDMGECAFVGLFAIVAMVF